MDHSISKDFTEGRRYERSLEEQQQSADISRELDGMELFTRALEDITKRLDDTPGEDFTVEQLQKWQRIMERLKALD